MIRIGRLRFIPGAVLAGALAVGCGASSETGRPHVVLIVVDTLRADAILDPAGRYETPNIDALAADGIVFERAFAHAPMTLPAHTSLFASRPPLETGVLNNGQHVPEDLPLFAEWLGDFGYDTRAVISIGTLAPGSEGGPGLGRGFDSYDFEFWQLASAEQVDGRLRTSLSAWQGDRPLFLFAHFSDPHEPYDSHEDDGRAATVRMDGREIGTIPTSNMTVWAETLELGPGATRFELSSEHRFKVRWFVVKEKGRDLDLTWEVGEKGKPLNQVRVVAERNGDTTAPCLVKIWLSDVPTRDELAERYVREVEYVDGYVGRIIDDLRARGVYDQSLILFTSDHGEALGEHGRVGHVEALTDEMIHVPLILKPQRAYERRAELVESSAGLVRHVDVVPTLLEMIGLPPLAGQRGASLLERADRVHLAETHKPEARKDKLCLRDDRYKMIYVVDDDRFLMYDLQTDRGEERDVFVSMHGERPEWPEQLRVFARAAATRVLIQGELDEETRRSLEALGYGS